MTLVINSSEFTAHVYAPAGRCTVTARPCIPAGRCTATARPCIPAGPFRCSSVLLFHSALALLIGEPAYFRRNMTERLKNALPSRLKRFVGSALVEFL